MKHLTAAAGIVLLCFVFATASPLEESATEIGAKQQRNQMTQPSITAANQATGHGMPEFRAKRGGRGEALKEQETDCITEMEEGRCTPSAQLASKKMQWSGINRITEKYNTSWICKKEDAFVDCGMNFTYNDQKLRVPVCGVYEIYSQVFFQSNDANTPAVVLHNVEINRNCDLSADNTAEFKSYAGLVPISVSRATTTNLVTVKMCAGGSVSVVIPQDSACCVHGGKSTYFSARLISEVDCDSIQ